MSLWGSFPSSVFSKLYQGEPEKEEKKSDGTHIYSDGKPAVESPSIPDASIYGYNDLGAGAEKLDIYDPLYSSITSMMKGENTPDLYSPLYSELADQSRMGYQSAKRQNEEAAAAGGLYGSGNMQRLNRQAQADSAASLLSQSRQLKAQEAENKYNEISQGTQLAGNLFSTQSNYASNANSNALRMALGVGELETRVDLANAEMLFNAQQAALDRQFQLEKLKMEYELREQANEGSGLLGLLKGVIGLGGALAAPFTGGASLAAPALTSSVSSLFSDSNNSLYGNSNYGGISDSGFGNYTYP